MAVVVVQYSGLGVRSPEEVVSDVECVRMILIENDERRKTLFVGRAFDEQVFQVEMKERAWMSILDQLPHE